MIADFVPTDRPVAVVFISQVPDMAYLRIDRKTGELDRSSVFRTLHPNDREPVEAALRVKDETDAFVLVVARDNKDAEDGAREALAMGADAGLLLVSQAVEHSDAIARANLFAQAVRTLPRADLVFVGTETMEPDWSLIGGAMSGILGWRLVPGGRAVVLEGDELRAEAMFGADWMRVRCAAPAVVTVRPRSHSPRWPTTWAVGEAYRTKMIHSWNLTDMEVDGRMLARMASHTETRSQEIIRKEKVEHEIFTDPPEQSARVVAKRLARRGFLGGF